MLRRLLLGPGAVWLTLWTAHVCTPSFHSLDQRPRPAVGREGWSTSLHH